ncbi:hypothetical protein [Duganella caerulea]|uniref:hypothetical protein n=1 Tax=Duganella caerulea TaxID=2885762 RepID=UPI004037FED5
MGTGFSKAFSKQADEIRFNAVIWRAVRPALPITVAPRDGGTGAEMERHNQLICDYAVNT